MPLAGLTDLFSYILFYPVFKFVCSNCGKGPFAHSAIASVGHIVSHSHWQIQSLLMGFNPPCLRSEDIPLIVLSSRYILPSNIRGICFRIFGKFCC